MQGMKKSFLLYERLLLDRVNGTNFFAPKKRPDGQAIPMEGILNSCRDDTWTYASIAKWAAEQCMRAVYGVAAILPLSVFIVGAALVFLVPTGGPPKELENLTAPAPTVRAPASKAS